MPDRAFLDSNVLIYAVGDDDDRRKYAQETPTRPRVRIISAREATRRERYDNEETAG